jgi:hypothetical protein
MEFYFNDRFTTYGSYDFPLIQKQGIVLTDLKLIHFSSIVKEEKKDFDATVHFFEDDDRFDEVWHDPDSYIGEIAQYSQVMSPNFSVYVNMPRVLQIFNTISPVAFGLDWRNNENA